MYTSCSTVKCHSDKCHSDKCHSDKCHSDKCHSDKCHSDKCHSDKCHSDKCHSVNCQKNREELDFEKTGHFLPRAVSWGQADPGLPPKNYLQSVGLVLKIYQDPSIPSNVIQLHTCAQTDIRSQKQTHIHTYKSSDTCPPIHIQTVKKI